MPPSYEEATANGATFEDNEDDSIHKGEPHIPKYPVYYDFADGPGPSTSPPSAPTANIGWNAN